MKSKSWLVLLLMGSADIAFAQTTSTRPPSFGAAPRLNAGAPTRQIGIRAAVDVDYDSNVFGINRSFNLRGGSRDDITVTPSVQLDIFLPVGRQSVFARGGIGYDFHVQNKQLDRERINLTLGGNLRLGRICTLQISDAYSRLRSNSGDIFIVTAPGVDPTIVNQNVEERNTIGGQAQCGGVAGLTATAGYRHTTIRNNVDFFAINDADQDSFDGSIGFQRPSLGRISIYGTYITSQFLNRTILGIRGPIPGIPNDGVTSYSLGGRFERDIGSRASIAASIGYSWVDPDTLFATPFRGSSYSIDLALRPTQKFSVDVSASRSAELSNNVFSTFSVTEVYALNATYRLNPRLSANFGTSHQLRDFRGGMGAGGPALFINEDQFTRAYGGVNYDLNRRLRLNALVSQQRRNADDPRFSYNNTTVSIGASLRLGR